MKEFAGNCSVCGRDIYCHDGFLNGIVNDDKSVLCFDCPDDQKGNSDKSEFASA